MRGHKERNKKFERLVNDCLRIMRKMGYKDLKLKHVLGKRIINDSLYGWNRRGNGDLISDLAIAFGMKGLRLKPQTLRQYARFATKFPEFKNFIRAHQVIAKQGKMTWTYVRENLLYDQDEVEEPIESAVRKAVKGRNRLRFTVRTIKKYQLMDWEAFEFLRNIKERGDFKGRRLKYFQKAVEEIAERVQEEHRLHDYIPHRFTILAWTLKRDFEDMSWEDWSEHFAGLNHYDVNTNTWIINTPSDIHEFIDFLVELGWKEFKKQRNNHRHSSGCGLGLPPPNQVKAYGKS